MKMIIDGIDSSDYIDNVDYIVNVDYIDCVLAINISRNHKILPNFKSKMKYVEDNCCSGEVNDVPCFNFTLQQMVSG
jgi:hypothetical protein